MIQKVSSPFITGNNTSFKARKTNYSNSVDHIDERKIINTVSGLALLAVAGIGYVKHKNQVRMQNIKQLNFVNQSIANHAVYSSNSRGADAVQRYSRYIAAKKASVLEYKIDNGLFLGKSNTAIKQIKNNLKKLQIMASL